MRRVIELPSVERLRELFEYDPATGVFIRRSSGGAAGSLNKRGYRVISIDRKFYYAHRLAWLCVHGSSPPGGIDHANRDHDDNRIANLRLATQSQNNANMRRPKHNTSGLKGVSYYRWQRGRKKWCARIKKNHKTVHLGYFETAEAAHAAYLAAAQSMFGEFARAE